MNGTYNNQTNGDYNSNASSTNGNTNGNSAATNSEIAKDEVGWYFVEQYYTTLSRNPEKLYVCGKMDGSSENLCSFIGSCSIPSGRSMSPELKLRRSRYPWDKRSESHLAASTGFDF